MSDRIVDIYFMKGKTPGIHCRNLRGGACGDRGLNGGSEFGHLCSF